MGHLDHTAFVECMPGKGCHIWRNAHVRGQIGNQVTVGMGAYIGSHVVVGDRCKIQNYACIYGPCWIGNEVFIGPGALLLNDKEPRACNEDGSLKVMVDWDAEGCTIHNGASIGAGAIIMPGVHVGACAMVGAGAIVTKDVEPGAVVYGGPARPAG